VLGRTPFRAGNGSGWAKGRTGLAKGRAGANPLPGGQWARPGSGQGRSPIQKGAKRLAAATAGALPLVKTNKSSSLEDATHSIF
jgi:hypothetical protein